MLSPQPFSCPRHGILYERGCGRAGMGGRIVGIVWLFDGGVRHLGLLRRSRLGGRGDGVRVDERKWVLFEHGRRDLPK